MKFSDEARSGEDPDIKAFAEKSLPMIRERQKMAQDLSRTVGKKR